MEKNSKEWSDKQKKFILRALTEPDYRKLLETDPAKALDVDRTTPEVEKEVKLILAIVKGIDSQILAVADELLCANGGGCGIA